jgi:hypothetical protein
MYHLIDGPGQAAVLALINTRIVKMTSCCLWLVTDINYGRGLSLKMRHWLTMSLVKYVIGSGKDRD